MRVNEGGPLEEDTQSTVKLLKPEPPTKHNNTLHPNTDSRDPLSCLKTYLKDHSALLQHGSHYLLLRPSFLISDFNASLIRVGTQRPWTEMILSVI